tara:strand:- start:1721 stop:5674 length:3954 start_codon:yes stop_codon:yes gene_type:complete
MSKKVKGTIFEPFYGYVKDQLDGRKLILGNNKLDTKTNTYSDPQLDKRYSNPSDGTNQEAFFAYTTEKQCFIRMMSGVDLDIKNADTVSAEIDELLELDLNEKGERVHGKFSKDHSQNMLDELYLKHPTGLAKQYILEGGTRFYNDGGGNKGTREGFPTGELALDQNRGFSYGDRNVRADAKDGFGVVPMPGIIDAEIRTVSDNGSLREAKINFVCFNRRQLEILELLYMRPGYMVCLEWGWNPYIRHTDGTVERENNDYTIRHDFFDKNKDIDALHSKIRDYKIQTQGNYDGFIGNIKNFSFKARTDGGYDCSTELIAAGSVLEFMTQQAVTTTTDKKIETFESSEVEINDLFLFGLRSIEKTLNGSAENYLRATTGTIATEEEKKNEEELLQFRQEQLNNFAPASSTYVYTQPIINLDQLESIEPITKPLSACNDPEAENFDARTEITDTNDPDYVPGNPDLCIYGDRSKLSSTQQRELNNIFLNVKNDHYLRGFEKVTKLFKQVQQVGKLETDLIVEHSTKMSFGLQSMFDGTIVKRVVQGYGNDISDTGLRSQLFVRWDLLCQMINHMGSYPDFKKDRLYDPITEMTYLNNNQRSYRKTFKGKKTKDPSMKEGEEKLYLSYEPPYLNEEDPSFNVVKIDESKYGASGEVDTVTTEQITGKTHKGKPHPLLGTSYDDRVCLLPHQPIFDELFESGKTTYDPNFQDTDKNLKSHVAPNDWFCSFSLDEKIGKDSRNKIGLIYFNLEFLIDVYENLRLEKADTIMTNVKYIKLNNHFNMYDYIQAIWQGVNDATANFYKFTIATEHERSNVARIIDHRFQNAGSEYYTFVPQGVNSITRQFNFDSSITRDMASMISIAARQPKSESSLEALSFKAFNKNIRHRFLPNKFKDRTFLENKNTAIFAGLELEKDIKDYQEICLTLSNYLHKLNTGHFDNVYEVGESKETKGFSHNKAKETASELLNLRNSIQNRYPIMDSKGKLNENRGLFIPGRVPANTEIIPIRYNAQLDGISGILPFNTFKIDDTRLPFGYRRSDLVFVVYSEKHKITSGQDWVVEIGGQIAFENKGLYDKGIQGELTKTKIVKTPKVQGSFDTTMRISTDGYAFVIVREGEINPETTALGYPDPYEEDGNGVDITSKFAIGYGSQTWYLDANNNEMTTGIKVTCNSWSQKVVNNKKRWVCDQCNIVDLYGGPITEAQAHTNKELHNQRVVYPAMAKNIKVPLTQYQFDAVVSYVYNIGTGTSGSPTFYKKLNAGDYAGAAEQMDVVKSGGRVMKGLIIRRAKEQVLFLTGKYDSKRADWDIYAATLMSNYGHLLS